MRVRDASQPASEAAVAATFTASQLAGMAADYDEPVSGQYYKKGRWNVWTATSYVPFDDLFAAAGLAADWASGAQAAYEGKGSADGLQYHSYDRLHGDSWFYPATEADAESVEGRVAAPAVLALRGASSEVATDAAAAQAANVGNVAPCSVPVFGAAEADYLAKAAGGMQFWTGVSEITLVMGEPKATVSFDSKGGSSVDSQEVVVGKMAVAPAAPAKEGYVFEGWFASADGGATLSDEVFDFAGTPVTEDLTLYAKWVPEAPVIVKVDGASGTYGYAADSLAVSVEATAPAGGSITGYQWYETSEEGRPGTLIAGATAARYGIPQGKSVGSYYYYCVVSGKAFGGESVSSASPVATVVVSKAVNEIRFDEDVETTVSSNSVSLAPAEGKTLVSLAAPNDGETPATVKYALSKSDELNLEGLAWQDSASFNGLEAATQYFLFAKVDELPNYSQAYSRPLAVKTQAKGMVENPVLAAVTYDPSKALADVGLPDGWEWADGTIVPTPSIAAYAAVFVPTPDELAANDYSNVEGWDPASKTVKRNVALPVAKAKPTIVTAPTASPLEFGQTLAESVLGGGVASVDGAFAWKDPSAAPSVSDSGVTDFAVVFTPADADNYELAELSATVSVSARKITENEVKVTVEPQTYTGSPIVPDAVVTVNGVVLASGVDYDLAATNNVEPGEAKYLVTFKGNYEGKVAGSFTIKPKPVEDPIVPGDGAGGQNSASGGSKSGARALAKTGDSAQPFVSLACGAAAVAFGAAALSLSRRRNEKR